MFGYQLIITLTKICENFLFFGKNIKIEDLSRHFAGREEKKQTNREFFFVMINSSDGKVRSYAIDEKTTHRAAKFCDYWRGSDRVGETHSCFGRYYR